MKNKNILVTGGAGFIGSNLVKALCNDNHVTVLDDYMSGHFENISDLSCDIIQGDVRDKDVINEAMRNVNIVFHLAASVGNKRSIDNPLLDAEINVLGTLNVLESARKHNVSKVIISSSAGIFGELKTYPIKEDHPIEPDSPYGCTKLCEEKLGLSYAKLYDVDVICLRYFNVYGPNQRFDAYGNVIPIFVFRMINNLPLLIYGDGEQTRDFVHVNDVVQANIKAAESIGISGAFNIASGTKVTINYLTKLITDNYNDPFTLEHAPERPGDVKHSLADISLAYNRIGYIPEVNLIKGIKEYVEWAINFSKKHEY